MDTCIYNAGKYKTLSKVGYFLTLFLGTSIIALVSFKRELSKTHASFSRHGIFVRRSTHCCN